jgi:hypothetical protein
MAGESISMRRADRRLRITWWVTLSCCGLILVHLLLFGTHWDMNPLRALPLLFLGMIWLCVKTKDRSDEANGQRRSLLLVSVYSLAVLARVVVRVPAGGAYGAGLLPIPLLLFFYISTDRLSAFAPSPEARRRTRRAVALLLTISLAAALGVFAFRQKNYFSFSLHTPRGDMRLRPSLGLAMSQAIDFISRNTRPGEYILGLPEGSSLNFLADRPAPLRYEIITPGFLSEAEERRAVKRLQELGVRYVFLFNRPTSEFGPRALGKDYGRTLMEWIEANYSLEAVFGENVPPGTQIGDEPFFIKCYGRRRSGDPRYPISNSQ